MFTWRIADQNDFHKVNALLIKAGEKWDRDGLRKRVIIPLMLDQLITFYKNDELCGFVTYAMMGGQSACHQATLGVQPADWRSGEQLWIVDLVALNGEGAQMFAKLKEDVREAVEGPVRYFRLKRNQTKRVELIKGDS